MIQVLEKAWKTKEKELQVKFSKIPSPSVGNVESAPISFDSVTKMSYMERLKLAREHPEVYQALIKNRKG